MTVRCSSARGMALLLVLIAILLLTMEVAMVGLIAIRGMGDEGLLFTRNTAARRGAEVALNRLNTKLMQYLNATGTPVQADTAFAFGQAQAIAPVVLTLDNPDSGTTTSPVTISAYLKERRGTFYHLVARATDGSVDLVLHRWVQLSSCLSSGGLTTIASDLVWSSTDLLWEWSQDFAANYYLAATSNGRVFFGEESATGDFWTWKEGEGLTTIVTGQNKPGYRALKVASDGRIFFGEAGTNGSFWTWKEGEGLTTLVSAIPNGLSIGNVWISSNDRVLFGEHNNGTSDWVSWVTGQGRIWTYKAGIGLSTVFTPSGNYGTMEGSGITPDGSKIFFMSNAGMYYWQDGVPPTTALVPGSVTNVPYWLLSAPDGRIYYNTHGTPAKVWTWKLGGPNAMTIAQYNDAAPPVGVDSSNRLFFTRDEYSGSNDGCYVYTPGIGLTTLAFGANTLLYCGQFSFNGWSPAYRGSKAYLNGMVWDPATPGLTTIYVPGTQLSEYVVDSSGRVYGGIYGDDVFLTWKDGLLTTLITGLPDDIDMMRMAPDGRIFFSLPYQASGKVWTWKDGLLTTIVGTASKVQTALVGADGRVYFGEVKATGGKFWTWKESQSCGE